MSASRDQKLSLNPMAFAVLLGTLAAGQSFDVTQLMAQDPFALGVRDTDPQPAARQQETFTLPPGFRIQLVAAEPQIAKPMNLAFDSRGRLWVSSSEEYPFAAREGQTPRDTIRILEDTNGDGAADVVTTFADQLNIPIGLYPYRDGVICFSIPNILFLRDTDGDDRCDVREILYGPFDTSRDTHGMCNAFRRGDDGWIYACHGFNNRSQVQGRDGHVVTMNSGNTFRFRPDGSRIEHFTIGQVNPFGMAIDHFGDHFTADCHTKPITLLMQGGYYDSFGKPHDGIGYVPNVMEHLHGSTAIGGIALGEQTQFPPEYQESSFGGNVMTSRINRNQLHHDGATVRAIEQPDLLSCSDPWFRPVDLVAGPDGALYVADFYNRIIGHYEVDLLHPGRDRFRGRIWKITYSDSTSTATPPAESTTTVDISHDTIEQLTDRLRIALPPAASLIADRITDQSGSSAVPAMHMAMHDPSPVLRRRALRILQRLNALTVAVLQSAIADSDETVRVHAYRTLQELQPNNSISADQIRELLRLSFEDRSRLVQRMGVMATAQHPDQSQIALLLQLHHQTPSADVHLRHAISMSLRNHFRREDWFREAVPATSDRDVVLLASICMALKTPAAGEYIASHVTQLADAVPDQLSDLLRFAAAHVSEDSAAEVARSVRQQFAEDLPLQLQILDSIQAGFAQRSLTPPPAVQQWATDVAGQLLNMKSPNDLAALQQPPSLAWSYSGHPDFPELENCWVVSRVRQSADGQQATPLFSSIDRGEQRTGIYRSAPFVLGDELTFYVAGHDGVPDKPAQGKNVVRLRDADTAELLRECGPPRNDVAQKVEWSTVEWIGRQAVLELIDGDAGDAFAWLAAGRFSDPRLNPSDVTENRLKAANLVGSYQLTVFEPALRALLEDTQLDSGCQSAVCGALVRLHPDNRMATISQVPLIAGASADLVNQALHAVLTHDLQLATKVLADAAQVATSAEQLRLAEQLVVDAAGAESLLSLVAAGRLSARLLLRPTIRQRLEVINGGALQSRLNELTAGLPDEDAAVEKLISERRRRIAASPGDAGLGRELFKKHCAICHQVANEGKKVGPNLDGIGGRGADRIIEDVLAPNRNVDVAFRTSTVVTTEGKAFSGLLRESEGDRISIVDSQGRETLLQNTDIDEKVPSLLSPMPANVTELLTDEQLQNLLTYLISLRH